MDKPSLQREAKWYSSKSVAVVLVAIGVLLFYVFENITHAIPAPHSPIGPKPVPILESDMKQLEAIFDRETKTLRTAVDELARELNSAMNKQKQLKDKISELEQENRDLAAFRATLETKFDRMKAAYEASGLKWDGMQGECKGMTEQCSQAPDVDFAELVESEKEALQELVAELVAKAAMLHSDKCTTRDYIDQKWDEYKTLKIRDDIGLRDYAMLTNDAKVVPGHTSQTFTPQGALQNVFHSVVRNLGLPKSATGVGGPEEALTQTKARGACFAMPGSQGELTVELSQPIHVGGVTLEHLNRVYSQSGGDSALKDFKVFGYVDKASMERGEAVLLLQDSYNINLDNPIQTFSNMLPETSDLSLRFVRLEVLNNHGNKDYTCLYRFRVHSFEDVQEK